MKKILVTGGNGFLAGRIIEKYKKNYEFYPFGKDELDIRDYEKSLEICKNIKPDYILHFGAIADTGFCERNEMLSYEINVVGTENMAKISKIIGSKLIFSSSDQIYNGTNKQIPPFDENDVLIPQSIYGKHKFEAEKRIAETFENYIILRLTWLFDMPNYSLKTNSNIVWTTFENLLHGKMIEGNTEEFRGITYVNELVDNFPKILQLPMGIYNTGSENNLSRYEILNEIFNIFEIPKEKLIKKHGYKRDIRIKNHLLKINGVEFSEALEGIKKLCKDYNIGGKNV